MQADNALKDNIIQRFGKHTMLIGVFLALLGGTGMLLPELMSLETVIFTAGLMLLAGGLWAVNTFKYSARSVVDWLKSLLLLFTGGWMLVSPGAGIAALGLLLSFYLFMDAFGSFALAQARYPEKGWGWMAVNGLFSVLLSVLFLIGWPATSVWLVGFYIAISLFFDGIALAVIGWQIKKAG